MSINVFDNTTILSQNEIVQYIPDSELKLLYHYTLLNDINLLKLGSYIRFVNKQTFEIHNGGSLIKIHKNCYVIIASDFTCYYYLPDNFYIFHKPANDNTNFNMLRDYKQQLDNYKPVKYNNTLIVKNINENQIQQKSNTKADKQRDAFEKLLQR
jgi:hypothetical protein